VAEIQDYEAPKVEIIGSVTELTLLDGSKTATTSPG
jgi:hypothetical protein